MSNNEFLKFPALEFNQNGNSLYAFVASSQTIYEKFDVSRRIDDKEQGYQRSFSKPRIKEIKNYLTSGKGLIPNTILVNIDKGNHSYNPTRKELSLRDAEHIGFIIDGQHRVKGSYEATGDFLLPVIATVDLDVTHQAQLFIKINKSQKGVATSLYLDLLELTDGVVEDFDDENVSFQRRAIEIANRLNDDPESPLFELIRTTGEAGRGISLSEFTNSLKPLVDQKSGKLLNYGFEEQYLIFKIYFKAFKAVFLEQWQDPSSLILKTVGFGGIMNSFYEIFTLVTQAKTQFSVENAIKTLSLIGNFKFNSETLPGGGIKAQSNAGKIIITELKKALRNSEDRIEIVE